jgi:isoquinoline 1-oxidoreductase
MTTSYQPEQVERDVELSAEADAVAFRFQTTRREFVQVLGAGVILAVYASAFGQEGEGTPARGRAGGRGGRGGGIGGQAPANLFARLHLGKDGVITVLCGKVECGQGARAEITQAAAEELGVAPAQVAVLLADTALTPNDGPTVGSGTTPRTIPSIRQAAAAAKDLLVGLACRQWGITPEEVAVHDGRVQHAASGRSLTYVDLANGQNLEDLFKQAQVARTVALVRVGDWRILGRPAMRPNAQDVVTGRHLYPSDVQRPGMMFGKVLRPASYNATLEKLDAADAKAIKGVTVIQDGEFVGLVAETTAAAKAAVEALALGARWKSPPHPSSSELADYLVKNARNVPPNRFSPAGGGAAGGKQVEARYFIPYVQHAPMEPRAAVAEWSDDGKLTVWTASQNPFAVRSELANAFRMPQENVRVIIPDFGGAFGGKHTGECAVEAARLAKGAGKPVSLRWSREEEFTWAYFRPAGIMQCQASLDANGRIDSWYFININSGPSAVQTPYAVPNNLCQTVNSQPPLRHGSYRGLAATANAWARECFMDELAQAAGKDPLEFRLAHLQDARLRDVLQAAATRFDWTGRVAKAGKNTGIGVACATEKGSYVATAAQVTMDRDAGSFRIDQLVEVFECGKILNPAGLLSQVQGAVLQGLGPVLREEMIFEGGRMQNASFAEYKVPRFADLPPLEVQLLDKPELASAGAGETPLITVAPAITNALSRVAGVRLRELPLLMPEKG